jgi:hypothetical protein
MQQSRRCRVTLRRVALLLAMLGNSSGCDTLEEWNYFRAYEGPTRSLDDVAVLLVSYKVGLAQPGMKYVPLEVSQIDGGDVPACTEYHLDSGTHRIVARVRGESRALGTRIEGRPKTVTVPMRRGRVYGLAATAMWDDPDSATTRFDGWVGGVGSVMTTELGFSWAPVLEDLGTIDEAAAGSFERYAGWKEGVIPVGGWSAWCRPKHWPRGGVNASGPDLAR